MRKDARQHATLGNSAVPPAFVVLDPTELLRYAAQWRQLAHDWASMAGVDSSGEATRLRVMAQRALCAVDEIDCLLQSRGFPKSPSLPRPKLVDVWPGRETI